MSTNRASLPWLLVAVEREHLFFRRRCRIVETLRRAGGSYSFLPVGATPEDMDELAAPVGERRLFAGEASYKARYGYADGALSSGLREAQRLIKSGTAAVTPGPA